MVRDAQLWARVRKKADDVRRKAEGGFQKQGSEENQAGPVIAGDVLSSTRKGETGGFFQVDRATFSEVLKLGILPAVAYLVLAAGTARDNRTTSWSVTAIQEYAGITVWHTAKKTLEALIEAKFVEVLRAGRRPKYSLSLQGEDWIWLPKELVTGARHEDPPISRIRREGREELLSLLLELYSMHDLPGAGGIPPAEFHSAYSKQRLGEVGVWAVWGFNERGHGGSYAQWAGDMLALERLGLVETVPYLYDGPAATGSPIHPISVGASGSNEWAEVTERAVDLASGLLRKMDEQYKEGRGEPFFSSSDQYHPVLPVRVGITSPELIGIKRLRYRPKTRMTAKWLAETEKMRDAYGPQYGEALKLIQSERVTSWHQRVAGY